MRRAQRVLPKALLLAAAGGAVCGSAVAATIPYDLTPTGTDTLNVTGVVGGTAIVSDFFTQPAGTGVFEPFLTIEQNSAGKPPTNNKLIEQGYNTDGHSNLYMDQQRPEWNTYLKLGDLAQINIGGKAYYAFELDANEPSGHTANLLSVDNVRIYTSATDTTGGVQNNIAGLGGLGTLRWALNNTTQNADGTWNGVGNNYIKLDSEQENVEAGANPSNGGSGKSDMILYVPATAFAGALATDYVWFWNLNGVNYGADDGLAAEAGYEEWRAVKDITHVPDGGATVALLGLGMLGLGAVRRKLS